MFLLLLAAVPFGAGAGEGPPDKPGPAAPPAAPDKKPSIFSDADAFTFNEGNRRDPFTVARRPNLPTIETPSKDKTGRTILGPSSKDEIPPSQREKMKEEGQKFYEISEKAFMEGDVLGAIENCDQGLEVFKSAGNIGKYRDLVEIKEKLTDLQLAAVKIKRRQDADRDFTAMALRLTGVVWRERLSRAVVDGNVVSKGAVVRSNDKDDVIVDEIRPDMVIMNFRGYRMTVPITDLKSGATGARPKK